MLNRIGFLMLRSVQILWLLPATILVWFIYVLPVWLIFRDLVFVRWAQFGVIEFVLAKKGLEKWHVKLWHDWAGWAGPMVFVWRGDPHVVMSRTRAHEMEHCRQQFYAGIFLYPIYILISAFIWVFMPSKSAYLHNPFEVAARKAAGQPVEVPKERYAGNRWPWW